MIISIHIGKTGGGTFLEFLEAAYGTSLHRDYHDFPTAPGHRFVKWSRRLMPRPFPVPEGTKVIHGHFLASKYLQQFPQAKLLVWLRDPVERVLSQYHYWKRNPDPRNATCRRIIAEGFDFQKFIRNKMMCNVQSRYLDGLPLTAFSFAGITESYEHSLALYCRMFGVEQRADSARRNENPERTGPKYEIDDKMRRLIEERNEKDVRLYRAALSRFRQLCTEWGLNAESGALRER